MITLYTAATPNGRKISIALEELNLEYQARPINLGANEQKEDWYLAINPNGKIPAIVDHDEGDLTIFESGAILVYLAKKAGELLPLENPGQYQVLQLLFLQVGGVGPMQGQANVFYRYWENRYPEVTSRYQNECKRLYGVLNRQLAERDYLAGEYSIADIAHFPWIKLAYWADIELEAFPQQWQNRKTVS